MKTELAIYQEMASLSCKMIEAARAQEVEQLVELEKAMAGLRDQLVCGNAVQVESDSPQIKGLMRRILDDDAEIRKHIAPWLKQLEEFLGNEATKRRVDATYGFK